jgi:Zn-dependent protease with chaperone function
MTPLGRTVWTGFFFDAHSAGRHPVTVTIATDGLHVRRDGSVSWWPYSELRQTQGFYPGEHVRLEKGEGLAEALVVPDAGFLEAIRDVAPDAGARFGRPERAWFRLRLAAVMAGSIILLLAGLYFWGIPALADFAASRVPVSWEESLGASAVEQITQGQEACTDPEGLGAMQQIIERLTTGGEAAPYQIRLTVVNEEDVNALAAPGGYVVVYLGLLKKTATAEELAGVLAHEIEHVRQRHGTKAMFRQLSMGVLLGLLVGDSGGLSSALHAASTLGELRYSRGIEEAADRGGMELLQQARIDPRGMLRFLEGLEDESRAPSGALAYLSTHPPTQERLELLRQLAEQNGYTAMPLLPGYRWEEITGICGAPEP